MVISAKFTWFYMAKIEGIIGELGGVSVRRRCNTVFSCGLFIGHLMH